MTAPFATSLVVVGVPQGAEACLEALLARLSRTGRAAFVVATGAEGTHPGLAPERLAGLTSLDVVAPQPRILPEANAIYPLAPGTRATFEDGALVATQGPQDGPARAPIDQLFAAAAEQFGARAIAILLAGSGADGVRGAREIKTAGGVVLAQAPEADSAPAPRADARGEATPAVAAADIVAETGALPDHLAAILNRQRTLVGAAASGPGDPADDADLVADILADIAAITAQDFRHYKRATLTRRIHRRMNLTGVPSLQAYRDALAADPAECAALVGDLLIGVTQFFRDPESWTAFAREAIDPAIAALADGDTLRAWAPGCATGEEAVTLAMLMHERIAAAGRPVVPLVFATDLDASSIAVARTGRYPATSLEAMDPARAARWFDREGDTVRVAADLRETLIFATQNVLSDPPFSRLDLITCRNLLIYLDPEAQQRLVGTLHFALRDGGLMMLGQSERPERSEQLFTAVNTKQRIYRRLPGTGGQMSRWQDGERRVPAPTAPARSVDGARPHDGAVRAMLRRFAPPAVHVDADFAVRGFHGDLGDTLSFRADALTGNLMDLVPAAWKAGMLAALHAAARKSGPVEATLPAAQPGEDARPILVEPVDPRNGRTGLIVYFPRSQPARGAATADGDDHPAAEDGGGAAEVAALRAELQRMIESGETSNEALQAANEEVTSANEELQSANEELETSREELQSLNEELTTINAELNEKVDELEAANYDLANLISSTDVATVFLDTDFRIRRFSARACDLVNIREGDVGRHFGDLSLRADDPTVMQDAKAVLATREPAEADVVAGASAYVRRITPYRASSHEVRGVIVTYADVTRMRDARLEMERQAARQASIAELGELALGSDSVGPLLDRAVRDVATLLDAPFVEVQTLDERRAAFRRGAGYGWPANAIAAAPVPNVPETHLGAAIRQPLSLSVADFATETRFAPSDELRGLGVRCGVCHPVGPAIAPWGVICAWRTDGRIFAKGEIDYLAAVGNILWLAESQAETARLRDRQKAELKDLIDGLPIMIGLVDEELTLEIANRAFERMGFREEDIVGKPLSDLLGAEAAETLAEQMAQEGGARDFALEAKLDLPQADPRMFLIHCAAQRRGGRVSGHYIAAIDIHERKMWEERNRVISDELDHRVKNILALVNTIARMTGRNAGSIKDFREVFSSRIASLSRTHSALAASAWMGMDLEELVATELAAYAGDALQQFEIGGPKVDLSMRATQSVALAIHELTTNAAKHGALADPRGRLSVTWEMSGEALNLSWCESGLTGVREPAKNGFGSSVVHSAIERQLRGSIAVAYTPQGLRCDISVPAEQLTEETGVPHE